MISWKAVVCVALLGILASPAAADDRPFYASEPVTVPNYSFETGTGTTVDGSWYTDAMLNAGGSTAYDNGGRLADWVLAVCAWRFGGRLNPADAYYANTTDATNPPPNLPAPADDTEVAFFHWGSGGSTGTSYVQSLADICTVEAETRYTAMAAAGQPLNMSPPNAGTPAILHILANGASVAQDNIGQQPGGTWIDMSAAIANYTADRLGDGSYTGQALKIKIEGRSNDPGAGMRQINFDNVRLYKERLAIMGDANVDKIVDTQDFTLLKANFGTGTLWGQADFNDDLVVDTQDFSTMKGHFGETAGLPAGAGEAAPEPATLALMALGGLAALVRRKRT